SMLESPGETHARVARPPIALPMPSSIALKSSFTRHSVLHRRFRLALILLLPLQLIARERVALDEGWRFHAGEVVSGTRVETSGPNWSTIDLPHDWSIGAARSPDAASA